MKDDLEPPQRRAGVRRELLALNGAAALVLTIVAMGALLGSQSVARAEARRDAEQMTRRMADLTVAPLLQGTLAGDPNERAQLDRTMRNRMSDGYLTEVTVWSADGRVLYSSNPALIGRQVPVPAEVVAAAISGQVSSDFEDHPELGQPASSTGAGYVEVYVPVTVAGQPRLAFEAYYDYARVHETAVSLQRKITPLVLVPLIVLQFFQLPIAVSLARRVRRHEAERARLLELTLSGSERERSQIAADLHDGPIQDLAGIGYALGAVAPAVPRQHAPLVSGIQGTLLTAIESLRQLMVDLYPPDLDNRQLGATINGLADRLRDAGTEVNLQSGTLRELRRDVVTALYRVARESLSNVAHHASATRVDIILDTVPGRRDPVVRLEIGDDGVGIDPARIDRRAEGHLGLRLLIDRVEALGGTMTIQPGPIRGTVVVVEMPVGRVGPRSA